MPADKRAELMREEQLREERLRAERQKMQKKHDEAKQEYNRLSNLEEGCRKERSQVRSRRSEYADQKTDYDRRADQIKAIIEKLTGKGGLLGLSVPAQISQAEKQLKKAQASYAQSIVCTGVSANSMETAYKYDTVEENAYSAAALEEYRKAEAELRRLIEELNASIKQCDAMIDALDASIRDYQNQKNECWEIMMKNKV